MNVDVNVLEIAVSDVAEVKYDSKVKDIITETEVDCSKVETPLYDVIDENNAIVVSKSKEEPPPTGFNVGSIVVAKCSEDEVWYNAKVQSTSNEVYEVIFIDYGNSAHVKLEHVLKSALDIDECVEINIEDSKLTVPDPLSQWANDSGRVKNSDVNAESEVKSVTNVQSAEVNVKPQYPVGRQIIARWPEDKVWYNAVVEENDIVTGMVDVVFTDYGNS